ncbi:MAG: hypothetical protein RL129_99 [Actinomycetota bacterium]|jgi:pyruvate dehydrogenase E1 component beta subunit
MTSKREISFAEAISEATCQSMRNDDSIVLMGIGLDYSSGVFGTTSEAFRLFGNSRVIDTPAMENALSGIVSGASVTGLRPVIIHARVDFMFLGLDQMLNIMAKWSYMFDGNAGSMPVVIRAIIGRGWGQGATHSQSIQSVLGHFPGLRVVMPSSPYEAKGMMNSALTGNDPVVILEHRNLFNVVGEVPEERYELDLFGSKVCKSGKDLTIVASSICVEEAKIAAVEAAGLGIEVEIIDIRSIQPLDMIPIIESVKKTNKLLIVDTSWLSFGLGSEIAARLMENSINLEKPLVRLGQAPVPAAVSKTLEAEHYPTPEKILNIIVALCSSESNGTHGDLTNFTNKFIGPY